MQLGSTHVVSWSSLCQMQNEPSSCIHGKLSCQPMLYDGHICVKPSSFMASVTNFPEEEVADFSISALPYSRLLTLYSMHTIAQNCTLQFDSTVNRQFSLVFVFVCCAVWWRILLAVYLYFYICVFVFVYLCICVFVCLLCSVVEDFIGGTFAVFKLCRQLCSRNRGN